MKIEIVKDWNGNEGITEGRNGRTYTTRGRWEWAVLVNGTATAETFTTKREAQAQADYLGRAAAILAAHVGTGTMIDARAMGKRGGLVSSEAKARAARANGKKGGRPRGQSHGS